MRRGHPSSQWTMAILFAVATVLTISWVKVRNGRAAVVESVDLAKPPAYPGSFHLVRIMDGDTIVVADANGEVTVRLIGIDAPEKNQPFGSEAAAMVGQMSTEHPIRLSGTGKDRYGRLLAHVRCGDTWLNLEMVRQGGAWVYRAKEDTFWADLSEAESHARSSKTGLWSLPNPIYPGDWRKGRR